MLALNGACMTDQRDDLTHDRRAYAAGELVALSPLVRRLIAPNPSPFTFTGTCGYIVGHGHVAVIDPGPDDETHIDTLVTALRGETIDYIVVTHTHRDHSPGARQLQKLTGAKIVGCARHVPVEHDSSGRLDASHDLEHVPDMWMADGDTLEGHAFTLTAVHTPGHASNHLCFSLNEENALFSGDHVMAWSTSIVAPPDGSMSDYMDSLDKLRARSERIFWPGHGGPVNDPPRYMRALANHRRVREAAIVASIGSGERTIDAIVARIYQGLDPRLQKAASLSVLAHLQDLVARRRVRADGPATMTAIYEPS
jgi:glyoxylase-like metal-dependent hydrolase (beta-lactamase superfamily II)